MNHNTLEQTLRLCLSDAQFDLVVNEAERQEKGRWESYRGTRCETLRMALCYLVDPKKCLPEDKEFFNSIM